jgi:hypothetical protein
MYCAPWCLAKITGKPITTFFGAMDDAEGMAPSTAAAILQSLGYRTVIAAGKHPDGRAMTVAEAAAKTLEYPGDYFYLSAAGHAMVAQDGVLHDVQHPDGRSRNLHPLSREKIRRVICIARSSAGEPA